MKSKSEAKRKVKENKISTINTAKLFLAQEMQQLEENLMQIESEMKREGSVRTPKNRKVGKMTFQERENKCGENIKIQSD